MQKLMRYSTKNDNPKYLTSFECQSEYQEMIEFGGNKHLTFEEFINRFHVIIID